MTDQPSEKATETIESLDDMVEHYSLAAIVGALVAVCVARSDDNPKKDWADAGEILLDAAQRIAKMEL
jgi:hypothetical protein